MKTIKNVDVKNKKVIIRCDLNVKIKDNKVIDDTRIVKSIKTIKYLLDNGASVIIMSHLGKVKTIEDKELNTLKPVSKVLSDLLKKEVIFIDETRGKKLNKAIKDLKPKEVLLIENTRYEDVPNKLESTCDDELSKYWASLGDIFVNDAFASSHRVHASVCGIAKYLPSYNGFLIEEELKVLNKVINNPERPFTVIMGGAKVDDKIDLIKNLINKCDNLIVGGGIANTFLKASGINVGNSLISNDMINEVKSLLKEHNKKIIMPVDVIVTNDDGKTASLKELNDISKNDCILDIGNKTINRFRNIIYNSYTIFINGTVGLYENELFAKGTEEILNCCADSDAIVVAAGGDSLSAANHFNHQDHFLISTGGGASLEYLANGDLIGIIK